MSTDPMAGHWTEPCEAVDCTQNHEHPSEIATLLCRELHWKPGGYAPLPCHEHFRVAEILIAAGYVKTPF